MIRVQNLNMQLKAGGHIVSILKGLNFDIPQKQMVAIIGPSGSGKSTLLGLLAGLDKPTSGSIQLNGHEITSWSEFQLAHFRRQNIGYIFQSFHLIPTLTALENVALPLELSGDSKTFELRKSVSSVSPLIFSLSPAYPNPFNTTTTIPFAVVDNQHAISLQIYDITGKLVARLVDDKFPVGNHTVQWNADGFSSGVYFLKMDAGSFSLIQKLMFLE